MRSLRLLGGMASAALLAALAPAAYGQFATQTLHYSFEDGTDTTIENFDGGPDGTLTGTNYSFVEGTPAGRALQLNGDDNTYIDTTQLHSALIGAVGRTNPTPGQEYTMSAVVTLGNTSGDNMVFGDNPATADASLHNGFRDANAHMGHWGADTTGGGVTPGTRMHVTWRYADTDGNGTFEQQIFINGASVAGPNTVDGLGADENTFIGTSANGGGLNAIIDNVRIFSGALSNAEIANLAATDPTLIPEPSAAALIGLGAAGLLLRRRRR